MKNIGSGIGSISNIDCKLQIIVLYVQGDQGHRIKCEICATCKVPREFKTNSKSHGTKKTHGPLCDQCQA